MRILFVDDENSVLEGIENRLRKYRKRWQMDFCNGGAEALEKMENCQFDAVVSDMRMPIMDGAELLARVRAKYGDTLRIVLTGQTAKEQVLRSLAVAHRVLNKPCDAILLEEAIAEASSMQTLVSNNSVRVLIDSIKELPALPRLHLQLTELIKSGDFQIHEAALIVEQEPVIASRILQLVNSSFYGLAREIVSIKDAVAYLGTDSLRGLILNLELFSTLASKKLAVGFSLPQAQKHSLLSAQFCKVICDGGEDSDLVYSAALLHDLGQLILAYVVPTEYGEVLQRWENSDKALVDIEREILGFTHADVGAYLLSLWDLPFSLINIIGNHHCPSAVQDLGFGPMGKVHIASEITMEAMHKNYSPRFDAQYLAERGLQSKLPEWRSLFEEMKAHE